MLDHELVEYEQDGNLCDTVAQIEYLGYPIRQTPSDFFSETYGTQQRRKGGAPMSAEVKPGYRQTEVGVIPEDWEVSTVGREFEIKLGKMVDAEKNVGVPKPYLGNKTVQWGRIDVSDLPTIPLSRGDIERFRLRKGDLLVCEGGEVGRAAIWDAQIEECYYQKALHRLRPLRAFNAQLMVALLRHWSDKGLLANYVTQTSIAHLPREKLLEVPMPLPPLPEQRAIAEALSDADALIESLEQLIAKKRLIKQGAMQELLTGKRRLPGFSGEWVVKRFGDVVDKFVNGGTPSTQHPEYWTGQIPWITGADISNQRVSEIRRYITEDAVRNSSTNVVEKGNLLLVSRTGVGKLAIAPFAVAISQDFTGVYVRQDRMIPEFLFRYFDYNSEVLRCQNQGTSIQGITRETLASIPIPVPQLAEQTAIAAILSDMDAEIAALEAKLVKARQVKQGMMQELLTGRIRLV